MKNGPDLEGVLKDTCIENSNHRFNHAVNVENVTITLSSRTDPSMFFGNDRENESIYLPPREEGGLTGTGVYKQTDKTLEFASDDSSLSSQKEEDQKLYLHKQDIKASDRIQRESEDLQKQMDLLD